MSEARTQCADCGRSILQFTADRHAGRCVPCHREAAAIPPPGFEVPRDLAERLAALNEDPANFLEMVWQLGADFGHRYIDKLEERNKLYREWSPRLRAFAHKCRQEQPPPIDDSLSNCERAKQRIYEAKLKPLYVGRNQVAICCMPLLAIPVAQRVWPKDDDRTVLLTPEEEARWNQMYSHPKGCFKWLSHFWWSIDDSPEREFSLDLSEGKTYYHKFWDEDDVQDGESPWLVSVGHSLGPFCGGGHTELWSWNGRQARFIKNVGEWIS